MWTRDVGIGNIWPRQLHQTSRISKLQKILFCISNFFSFSLKPCYYQLLKVELEHLISSTSVYHLILHLYFFQNLVFLNIIWKVIYLDVFATIILTNKWWYFILKMMTWSYVIMTWLNIIMTYSSIMKIQL